MTRPVVVEISDVERVVLEGRAAAVAANRAGVVPTGGHPRFGRFGATAEALPVRRRTRPFLDEVGVAGVAKERSWQAGVVFGVRVGSQIDVNARGSASGLEEAVVVDGDVSIVSSWAVRLVVTVNWSSKPCWPRRMG